MSLFERLEQSNLSECHIRINHYFLEHIAEDSTRSNPRHNGDERSDRTCIVPSQRSRLALFSGLHQRFEQFIGVRRNLSGTLLGQTVAKSGTATL